MCTYTMHTCYIIMHILGNIYRAVIKAIKIAKYELKFALKYREGLTWLEKIVCTHSALC